MEDGVRVIFVDDDEDMGEVIRLKLDEKGIIVDYAETSEKGIEIFNPQLHRAIIVDYFMPGIDGMDVIRNLRQKFGWVNGILLSGAESDEIKKRAAELKVPYIVKGFLFDYIEQVYEVIMNFSDDHSEKV